MFQHRILYLAKLSSKCDRRIKALSSIWSFHFQGITDDCAPPKSERETRCRNKGTKTVFWKTHRMLAKGGPSTPEQQQAQGTARCEESGGPEEWCLQEKQKTDQLSGLFEHAKESFTELDTTT